MKERISKIIDSLSDGVYEREEVIAVSLLAALADQNIFLLGPPGTAKSLISRRLSKVFDTNSYFEYLMQRFSTPEEVFGPVSIAELKKDNYIRKVDGFLPKADFAFLDEIWKSSPAILNTLLTIINEKLFRNGINVEKVPLKVLISASNETPPENQGLEALYDRFLVRLHVPPMSEKTSFESLLQSTPVSSETKISDDVLIKHEEWELWQLEIEEVKLSAETLTVINDIRLSFSEKGEKLNVYVSDRRWQRAAMLLKSAAFFCGRKQTNLVDALLLRHCLWTTNDNRDDVIAIVEAAVRSCGFETGISLHEIEEKKNQLENEIKMEFQYPNDIYDTVKLSGNNEYFECTEEYKNKTKTISFYIPQTKIKSSNKFSPIDENGNELDWITCCFDKQGSCSIKICEDHDNQEPYKNSTYTPDILFHKGDKKKDINSRLINSLNAAVSDLTQEIENIIKDVNSKSNEFRKELDSPFVQNNIRDIALESVTAQMHELKLRHTDCSRLKSLIG